MNFKENKTAIIIGTCCTVAILLMGLYALQCDDYRFGDRPISVEGVTVSEDMQNAEVGGYILGSMVSQLRREHGSSLGWTRNDLAISPTSWLDNRSNRQEGVGYSTLELVNFFTGHLGRYGGSDGINVHLDRARNPLLNLRGEWGFMFISDEIYHDEAFELINLYTANLLNDNMNVKRSEPKYSSMFNMKTDDVHALLMLLNGDKLTDYARTEVSGKVGYFSQDDTFYRAKGAMLTVRDVFFALVASRPDIMSRGGQKNVDQCKEYLDQIMEYDPILVWDAFGHRAELYRLIDLVSQRLLDIQNAMDK